MFEVHISKHSLFRHKITVGCLTSTYPSIHVETPSRSQSVACGAHIRAFTILLTKTLSRSRSVVWCVHVVFCELLVVCVLCAVCVVCVVCVVLSLSRSLSFSLFSFFFFFCSCSFSFFFSILFSPPNTMERTDQPTRRPTSRYLNVIWRRASAQQSVPSLLLLSPPSSHPPTPRKKKGDFLLQEYFWRGIYFYYSFVLGRQSSRVTKVPLAKLHRGVQVHGVAGVRHGEKEEDEVDKGSRR